MCANHAQNTGNAAFATSANVHLTELLAGPELKEWTPCPEASATGVCGLLLTERYGPALWQAIGSQRERSIYESLLDDAPRAPEDLPVRVSNCAFPGVSDVH